jgi:erythronate-4-phosphate dehydrogenase
MKIVCDQNMPHAVEAFATLGEVVLLDGRAIRAENVRTADLLFTRSTTRVNRALLDGSRVRFYGSAVIGTDHIDAAYLQAAGIPWCAAPGCNAESVGQYVTAALLWLAGRHSLTLSGRTLGVIGVGNVGRKVVAKGRALGMRVLACDPPRQRDPNDIEAQAFVSLAALLAEADFVTCHVPLTRDGVDRTWHLIDAAALAQMKPGVVLLNAARGPVTDTDALLAALGTRVSHIVMDTWEGEPAYRTDLLTRADLATPHIAGHSFEGKVNGTAMVYRAACRFLGVAPTYDFPLPEPPVPVWTADAAGRNDEAVLRDVVLATYDIEGDDRRLRESCVPDATERARAFDRLRTNYPMRREFASTRVMLRQASPVLGGKVAGLGFRT